MSPTVDTTKIVSAAAPPIQTFFRRVQRALRLPGSDAAGLARPDRSTPSGIGALGEDGTRLSRFPASFARLSCQSGAASRPIAARPDNVPFATSCNVERSSALHARVMGTSFALRARASRFSASSKATKACFVSRVTSEGSCCLGPGSSGVEPGAAGWSSESAVGVTSPDGGTAVSLGGRFAIAGRTRLTLPSQLTGGRTGSNEYAVLHFEVGHGSSSDNENGAPMGAPSSLARTYSLPPQAWG